MTNAVSTDARTAGPGTDEVVVLLDPSGAAIGTQPKRDAHHSDTALHLGFSTYVFDADGRLLVTTRAHDKATFPGVLTNSFCGHPAPGESLEDAVARRGADELGLAPGDLQGVRLVLPDFAYRAEMDGVVENELCPVLVAWLRPGVAVVADPEETASVESVEWAGFSAAVLAGELQVSRWCREQVPLLVALGDDPADWPEGDPALLPGAVRLT